MVEVGRADARRYGGAHEEIFAKVVGRVERGEKAEVLFLAVRAAIEVGEARGGEGVGRDGKDGAGEEEGQWLLMRNDTPIYLDAWAAEQRSPWNYFIFEEDPTTVQMTIPFCYAPTLQREAFLEELLTVNLNLLYGKFTYNAKDNVVALIYRLPGLSFHPADLPRVIDGLMYYSEMAYHVLKDEFTLKRVLVEES